MVSRAARLNRLDLPDPWGQDLRTALELIEVIDVEIDASESESSNAGADYLFVQLLTTVPGIGLILGYTIASEIRDIHRFESSTKLVGYSGLTPRVIQSGGHDVRAPLSKHGPKYLGWALGDAVTHGAPCLL